MGNSFNGGMVTTKLTEADKTGREAEVMNWEERKFKGIGGQRGSVGTGAENSQG